MISINQKLPIIRRTRQLRFPTLLSKSPTTPCTGQIMYCTSFRKGFPHTTWASKNLRAITDYSLRKWTPFPIFSIDFNLELHRSLIGKVGLLLLQRFLERVVDQLRCRPRFSQLETSTEDLREIYKASLVNSAIERRCKTTPVLEWELFGRLGSEPNVREVSIEMVSRASQKMRIYRSVFPLGSYNRI